MAQNPCHGEGHPCEVAERVADEDLGRVLVVLDQGEGVEEKGQQQGTADQVLSVYEVVAGYRHLLRGTYDQVVCQGR